MNRPDLKLGDVVRLSHKGLIIYRGANYKNKAMTVVGIPTPVGRSQDGRDKIRVAITLRNRIMQLSFPRKELWFTGYNISDKGKMLQLKKQKKSSAGQPALNPYANVSFTKPGSVVLPPSAKSLVPPAVNLGILFNKPVAQKKVVPDPHKQHEVECCMCKRMADFGYPCWNCGTVNK